MSERSEEDRLREHVARLEAHLHLHFIPPVKFQRLQAESVEKLHQSNRIIQEQEAEIQHLHESVYVKNEQVLVEEKTCDELARELAAKQQTLKLREKELCARLSCHLLAGDLDVVRAHYQKRLDDVRRKYLEEGEGRRCRPWKECESCMHPYDETRARTPRVLHCGHTLCETCVEVLLKDGCIRCPFDRQLFLCDDVGDLPKNFLIFQ